MSTDRSESGQLARRVLVVEDDADVRRYLNHVLERNDIQAVEAETYERAQALLRDDAFDVVLLDVGLPERTGWDLLAELRERGDQTPVIFLTGRHSLEERVKGLDLGADDYIAKPFEPRELLARIQAVLRRRASMPVLEVGDLRIDVARRRVERGGQRVDVSPREFDLLLELVEARGRILSRTHLLKSVWGIDFDPGTNVVDVQIARLRRKLDRHGPPLIETCIGKGYRLPLASGTE